jgi:hypothetical protein
MPNREGVLGDFYPLKTRVFQFVPPVVQNMPKMTKFGLETPSKFDVQIL